MQIFWKKLLLLTRNNALVWANAFFLLLLLFLKIADPLTIVFAYFSETIIIGIIHLVKLWLVIKYGKEDVPNANQMSGIPLLFFFAFHYGFFIAIQSIFAFSIFEGSVPGLKDGFHLIDNYTVILSSAGITLLLGSILVNNLGYFYSNFYKNEKYKEYAPNDIFYQPYVRIFIQQFVVIFSFFLYIIFNSEIAAAVTLIFFRLVIDLALFSIKKDSKMLDMAAKKLAKEPVEYSVIKKQLQQFTE